MVRLGEEKVTTNGATSPPLFGDSSRSLLFPLCCLLRFFCLSLLHLQRPGHELNIWSENESLTAGWLKLVEAKTANTVTVIVPQVEEGNRNPL